jgi:hypothetical protein
MVPPQVQNVPNNATITSNTLLPNDVVVDMVTGSGSTLLTASAGWTQDSADTTTVDDFVAATYHNLIASAGAVSDTMTWSNSGGNGTALRMVFRTVEPTFGMVQQGLCTNYPTTTVSLTCTTNYPLTAGDHIRIGYRFDGDMPPLTLSNGASLVGTILPSAAIVNEYQEIMDYPVTSTTSTPISFTITGTTAGKIDMMFWEVRGLASTGWLASSTVHVVAPSENVSPNFDSGSVYIQQPGIYYADSLVSVNDGSNYNQSTTGFNPEFLGDSSFRAWNLNGLYDKAVTIATPGGVDNSIELLNPSTPAADGSFNMLVLSGASPYLFPITKSTVVTEGVEGISVTLSEPSAACFLIAAESLTAGDGGPWLIDSSPALTWTLIPHGGGTTSDQYAIWKSSVVPAGDVTINMNSSSVQVGVATVVKVCNVNTVDTANSATSNTTSVGPVTITTDQNNEFIMLFAMAGGSSEGPGIIITPESGTNSTLRIPFLLDPASIYNYDAIAPTIGSYGASWTCDAGCGNMIGVVIGLNFTYPALPGTGSQHSGNGQLSGNTEVQ